MTANELYEIVKDVPREAWPVNLWYFPAITCGDKAVMNADGAWRERPNGQFVSDATAESAFVGSMTAWLVKTGTVTSEDLGHYRQVGLGWNGVEYEGDSLVAALAAACKEVAQ